MVYIRIQSQTLGACPRTAPKGKVLDSKEILRLYDTQVRANPVATPSLKVVTGGQVTRLEGAFNFICNWTFDEHTAPQAVASQASYFKKLNQTLMWRVYDHDQPSNIGDCLTANGFTPSPKGTMMVLSLEHTDIKDAGHDIRRVTTTDALKDYLKISQAAFGDDEVADFEYFEQLLALDDFSFFCGYVDGQPAVCSHLQIQPNSIFGQLFGGGVSEAFRGKGLYRASVATRVALARVRGLKYLTTEARETSRPILESLGFVALTKETTWILSAE